MGPRLILLALLSATAWAGPVRAELQVLDSLEWMTDDSQLILRGKVVSVQVPNLPSDAGFRDITIDVQETLRGMSPGMRLVIRSWEGGVKQGGEDLFFLKRGHDVYRADDYRRPIVENRWTQRVFWNGNPYGAINLQNPGRELVTAKLQVLQQRDQILKVVKDRIRFIQQHPRIIKPAEPDP